MKSVEYIKRKIDELVARFTNIRCRYEHDAFSNTHLIEVLPGSVYKSDLDYAQVETLVIDEFIEKFPNESICFITDDSLVSIQNPIYERKGITHDIMEIAIENKWIDVPLVTEFSYYVPSFISNINIFKPDLVISGLHSFEFIESAYPPAYDIYPKLVFPFYSVLPQFNYKVLLQQTEETDEIDSPSDYSLPLAA